MTRQAGSKHTVAAGDARPRFSGEPSVREMLADPVVQAVMAVDRVTPDDVMTVIAEARERLSVGEPQE